MKYELNNSGDLAWLESVGVSVPFRKDKYSGPALFFEHVSGKIKKLDFAFLNKNEFVSQCEGIVASKSYSIKDDTLILKLQLEHSAPNDLQRLTVRLGIDSYMESYPEWNNKFFPTMLRCEKTHFLGYFMSPSGKILGVCTDAPLDSYSIDYNTVIYDDGENTGHRVYSACLDLLNKRVNSSMDKVKGRFDLSVYFRIVSSMQELSDFWTEITKAPKIVSKKWTYEQGEPLDIFSDGELSLIDIDGNKKPLPRQIDAVGEYNLQSEKNGKITSARIFVRPPFEVYLKAGANAVFDYPQKAATHCESYYGYTTAFVYACRSKDSEYLSRLRNEFECFYETMTIDGHLKKDAAPGRIQNISTLISILSAAYRCTKDKVYLKRAIILAEDLIATQTPQGAYLNEHGVHYTCVIYPAKSLMELYSVLKDIEEYFDAARLYRRSFTAAVYDLIRNLDNVQTEGEQTFEDGMISCASLQLGLYALGCEGDERETFTRAAEYLMKKHECLQQNMIWDSRVRGCTLRFWETMYDVMVPQNMTSSPHGWTSWKVYATYYLYLLTANSDYLVQTMDTLCASLQCYDLNTKRLNWAYINNPIVCADVFTSRNGGMLEKKTVGEQYLPMISDWWRSKDNKKIIKGYGYPLRGLLDDEYHGACCDNDVHEHFKALDEVGFVCYVHETDEDEFLTYNCTFDGCELKYDSGMIDGIRAYFQKEREITINGKHIKAIKGFNVF